MSRAMLPKKIIQYQIEHNKDGGITERTKKRRHCDCSTIVHVSPVLTVLHVVVEMKAGARLKRS